MSGFQIPGLGQAKPNETLPPLPADTLAAAAAAAAADDHDMKDSGDNVPDAPMEKVAETDKPSTNTQPEASTAADSMAIDQPESPPSLTHALEAAIGGLDNGTGGVEQLHTREQPQEEGETQNGQEEHPEFEMDSSPYESSSESSSSDSSSDDSDNEGYELLGVEETARLLMEAEGGSDDDGDRAGKGSSSAQVRTKNEVPDEVIPRPDVTITPEMKIEELGSVEHVVENLVLIKAITPGEYQVLDSGSVLCNSDRVVIGAVAETMGKVLQPLYTVRFNSEDEIKELGVELGTKVFYPVDHASYVFTEPLKNLKGSDASNLHDEEVGDEEMEFSDDEKEAEYKRAQKQKKKDKWKNAGGRGGKDPHPLRQESRPDAGLNYDDDEGPYKPLSRPPGFGSGPSTGETYDLPPRSNFQRGRRGDSRGRGGRGKGSGRGGRGGNGPPRDGYSQPPQGQHAYPQPPQAAGSWGGNAVPPPPIPGQAAAPSMPNFGFQFPGGWPPAAHGGQAASAAPPPPPPGWTGQQGQQGQSPANGAFLNPALFAALMGQLQHQAQNGQGQYGGQQQPPPPGGRGQ